LQPFGGVVKKCARSIYNGTFLNQTNIICLISKKFQIRNKQTNKQPVRSAYQPSANSTFLSERISHQQPASSTLLSEQTSHQPPANRTGLNIIAICGLAFAFPPPNIFII
jgi:hypothetical protein